MHDPNCIFCKIVRGEIPSRKVYEDEHVLAFHDIHPIAPVHLLIVPREHIASLAQSQAQHERGAGQNDGCGGGGWRRSRARTTAFGSSSTPGGWGGRR